MTRYALYFAPAAHTAWWQAGCSWLGRDPLCGAPDPMPGASAAVSLANSSANLSANLSAASLNHAPYPSLTRSARHYGFHATLKAPFRLAPGFSVTHLFQMAQAFAAHQRALTLAQPTIGMLGNFLALQGAVPQPGINALAMRCVRYFDLLRAPPSAEELARRRSAGLTAHQDALLQRWGYPYTDDAFRFHMTLSDRLDQLDAARAANLRIAAAAHFASAMEQPLQLDNLSVWREADSGEPFELLQRFGFGNPASATVPSRGQLFCVVGPSGSGKDALLAWVAQRLPANASLVFFSRVVTRPATLDSPDHSIDQVGFWQAQAAGEFTLHWQAHELCYGIPRGIDALLAAGRDVVINGSRAHLGELRQAYPEVRIAWLEVAHEQRRQRLTQRGRETGESLQRRLARGEAFPFDASSGGLRLDNNGSLAVAGATLLTWLTTHKKSRFPEEAA
ncbi:MAG: phosphonate metabolism protein/1,5-bisphosphokinase (PRPP-forming) PhnN [Pseudomonadota bacterium]|nr:phosphonate metabolism protein/1,5-bisphosphokinase (PRPP-forming) PhnN [Pseudomonadota bacterium]